MSIFQCKLSLLQQLYMKRVEELDILTPLIYAELGNLTPVIYVELGFLTPYLCGIRHPFPFTYGELGIPTPILCGT